MTTLYLDCFSGVSGNMLLGALVDLGLDPELLASELKKMPLGEFSLEVSRVSRAGIQAVHVDVVEPAAPKEKHLPDILAAVENSSLEPDIRRRAAAMLERLGRVEAAIHGVPLDKVHLHELSGVDTIVDVVGVLIGLRTLGIEKVVSSPINVGAGTVKTAHGVLPVPAPATAKLLTGKPIYSRFDGELTTPTGALIVTETADSFGPLPLMKLYKTGHGAGTRELHHPNVLRAFLGASEAAAPREHGAVCHIQTNIDDLQPEVYSHLFDKMFDAGALDFTLTPVIMKKNRPGILIDAFCDEARLNDIAAILLRETTTLGLRVQRVQRICLERRSEIIETRHGEIRVKIGILEGKIVNVAPEYEDCARAARASGDPLIDIMNEAAEAGRRSFPIGSPAQQEQQK